MRVLLFFTATFFISNLLPILTEASPKNTSEDIQIFVSFQHVGEPKEVIPIENVTSSNDRMPLSELRQSFEQLILQAFPVLRSSNLSWQKNLAIELQTEYDLNPDAKKRSPSEVSLALRIQESDLVLRLPIFYQVTVEEKISHGFDEWFATHYGTFDPTARHYSVPKKNIFSEPFQSFLDLSALSPKLVQAFKARPPIPISKKVSLSDPTGIGVARSLPSSYQLNLVGPIETLLKENGFLRNAIPQEFIDELVKVSTDPLAEVENIKDALEAKSKLVPKSEQEGWGPSQVLKAQEQIEKLITESRERITKQQAELKKLKKGKEQFEDLQEKYQRLRLEVENYLALNHRFVTEFGVQFAEKSSGLEMIPDAALQKTVRAFVEGTFESRLQGVIASDYGRLDEENLSIRITPKLIGMAEVPGERGGFWGLGKRKTNQVLTVVAKGEVLTPLGRRSLSLEPVRFFLDSRKTLQLLPEDQPRYDTFFERLGSTGQALSKVPYRETAQGLIENSHLKADLVKALSCKDILEEEEDQAGQESETARHQNTRTAPK